jgi:predicted component of type VI protein secretion system
MQSVYRMVMRSGPSVGKVYPLDRAELFIGRDLNNEIVINDPEISRRHSRLFAQGDDYVIEDLGSTNGTFVNGQRLLGQSVLRPGDMITFGERLSMVFESSEVDQDATMVSPAVRGGYPPREPEPEPERDLEPPMLQREPVQVYTPPPPSQPVSSYANQVPNVYPAQEPMYPQAEPRRPRSWLIAVGVLVLLCLCLSAFLYFAPVEFWCLFPVWPAGACP